MTILQSLKAATDILEQQLTPQLDAEVLLSFILKKERSWVLTHTDEILAKKQIKDFGELVQRRLAHEPIAYITGKKAFYGKDFLVTPSVLIPRPESELMIDLAKEQYRNYQKLVIADIGTGSGCLAITISTVFPTAKVIGVDTSLDALEIAKTNANKLDASGVTFLESNLLELFEKQAIKLDLILANLPYLTESDLVDSITAPDLAFEPKSALIASDNGFALMKKCAQQAVSVLKPHGKIYFEMMPYQVESFTKWVKEMQLPYLCKVKKDLANLDRIVILELI